MGSNRELAERVDAVVLCHKPAGLSTVAQELAGAERRAQPKVSTSGADR